MQKKRKILGVIGLIAIIILGGAIISYMQIKGIKSKKVQAKSTITSKEEAVKEVKENTIKKDKKNEVHKEVENSNEKKSISKTSVVAEKKEVEKKSSDKEKVEHKEKIASNNTTKEVHNKEIVPKMTVEKNQVPKRENEREVKYVIVPNFIKDSCSSVYVKLWHVKGLIADQRPEYVESQAPPNTVISQDPAPGARVPYGTEVKLVCSKESTLNENRPYYNATLPDVVGMKEGVAEYKLNKMGFGMVTVEVDGPKNLSGTVQRTVPSAGTQMKANEWVKLYVYNYVTPADKIRQQPI